MFWGVLLFSLAVTTLIFREGLWHMLGYWQRPEYSHGYLIPVISLFLLWQRLPELRDFESRGSWFGLVAIAFGLCCYLLGELSTIYTIVQYSFLLVLYGLAYAALGWRGFRVIAIPLFILLFMIPLPNFIYNNLSSQLQLLSSRLGVAVIRLFDISVYLAGNVIDLGSYKLQVVEACSGLRYLFPLMTIGFIVAYFYQGSFWKRAFVFLSTIPITVLMNSFRIGVIGVMVEYWGPAMADGFLHDFEGWAVFMMSFGVLFVEMWVLSYIGGERRPLREIFGVAPQREQLSEPASPWRCPPSFFAAAALLLVALVPALALPHREEVVPERMMFLDFPMTFGSWVGRRDRLEDVYLQGLKLTDYALLNYVGEDQHPLNFYVAYYASQRKGQSVHSPRSCLPGDGWEIEQITQRDLADVRVQDRPLRVNRVLIRKGDSQQLVYYWFQQRGRVITNEYLVKWYIFWDALTRNRTDGALVRLVTPVSVNKALDVHDAMLATFAAAISPELQRYVPE